MTRGVIVDDTLAEVIGEATETHAYKKRRVFQGTVTIAPGTSWPESEGRANVGPFRWMGVENRGVANSGNDIWVTFGTPYSAAVKPDVIVPAGEVLTFNAAAHQDPAIREVHLTNVGAAPVDVYVILDLEPVVFFRQAMQPASGGASPVRSTALNTGQATIGAAAGLVIAANVNRRSVVITNVGSAAVYVGNSNAVTTASGEYVGVGQSISFDSYTGTVYAVSGSAGNTVTYAEESA